MAWWKCLCKFDTRNELIKRSYSSWRRVRVRLYYSTTIERKMCVTYEMIWINCIVTRHYESWRLRRLSFFRGILFTYWIYARERENDRESERLRLLWDTVKFYLIALWTCMSFCFGMDGAASTRARSPIKNIFARFTSMVSFSWCSFFPFIREPMHKYLNI